MRAIYAFSGDPVTFGHLDIVRRASKTYDELVVAIGENPTKQGKYFFTPEERLALAKQCTLYFPNVSCVPFQGLLGEYAYRNGFDVIVRGIRNNTDLEDELVLFAVNDTLHPSVDTVFFPTQSKLSHISSGVVKAIVQEKGDASKYCPLCVKEALEKKLLQRYAVGITGGIATGKSFIAEKIIAEIQKSQTAFYVSLDKIGHYILGNSPEKMYQQTRKRIQNAFGKDVCGPHQTINRKALGKLVFADAKALSDLEELMHEPMMARLYEETRKLTGGIIILEGAILVEANWTSLVNNNVVLVDAPTPLRVHRLFKRDGMNKEEAISKIQRQWTFQKRKDSMEEKIRTDNWGRIWNIMNDRSDLQIKNIVEEILERSS